jgi:hypothetical protein
MTHLDPHTPIPRSLLALECCGTALMIVGIIESFGLQLLMPQALRFSGYGLVFIAIGFLLILPLMVFLGLSETNPSRPPRPHF